MSTDVLFQPLTLKNLTVANRIVMAPMTRAMAPEGIPGAAQAEYYRRRAAGGAGLILTECTVIDRRASRNDPGIPFFHGEAALAGWDGVAKAVHGAVARSARRSGIPDRPGRAAATPRRTRWSKAPRGWSAPMIRAARR
ncbi:MAG TPA: hypothetical protein VGC09_07620 [Rhodopila sp.]